MDQVMDADIIFSPPIHKDLRSAQREFNRNAKQSNKYYGYRGVDPNWVGQPYYALCPGGSDDISQYDKAWYSSCAPLVAMPQRMKQGVYTKHDMYQDRSSDIWPLDRRHHKGKRVREKHAVKRAQLAMGTRLKQRSKGLAFEVSTGKDLIADSGSGDETSDTDCSFCWADDGQDDGFDGHQPLAEALEVDQVFTWTSPDDVDAEFSPTDDFILVYAPLTQYSGNLVVHSQSDSSPDWDDSAWEMT